MLNHMEAIAAERAMETARRRCYHEIMAAIREVATIDAPVRCSYDEYMAGGVDRADILAALMDDARTRRSGC